MALGFIEAAQKRLLSRADGWIRFGGCAERVHARCCLKWCLLEAGETLENTPQPCVFQDTRWLSSANRVMATAAAGNVAHRPRRCSCPPSQP
eukprot:365969-Chlamydomonas_euryale.AAC.11